MALVVKNPPAHGTSLQYSCLENSIDIGACALHPWGCKELDTAEHLSTKTVKQRHRETQGWRWSDYSKRLCTSFFLSSDGKSSYSLFLTVVTSKWLVSFCCFLSVACLEQANPTQWCIQERVKLVPPCGLREEWGPLYWIHLQTSPQTQDAL